jgi:hypothetical protein
VTACRRVAALGHAVCRRVTGQIPLAVTSQLPYHVVYRRLSAQLSSETDPYLGGEVTLENAQPSEIGIAANRGLYEHAIATLTGKPASSFSMPVRSPKSVPILLAPNAPWLKRMPSSEFSGQRTTQR